MSKLFVVASKTRIVYAKNPLPTSCGAKHDFVFYKTPNIFFITKYYVFYPGATTI